MKIENTKTVKLLNELLKKGFNAELWCAYSNEYNQDYCHLEIKIKDVHNHLNDIWEICRGFEILLAKFAKEENTYLAVRKHREFAELIEQEGANYNNIKRRESTPLDNCTVFKHNDWKEYYKILKK